MVEVSENNLVFLRRLLICEIMCDLGSECAFRGCMKFITKSSITVLIIISFICTYILLMQLNMKLIMCVVLLIIVRVYLGDETLKLIWLANRYVTKHAHSQFMMKYIYVDRIFSYTVLPSNIN